MSSRPRLLGLSFRMAGPTYVYGPAASFGVRPLRHRKPKRRGSISIHSRHEDSLMFWVGLDTPSPSRVPGRLPPKNSVQRGPTPQDVHSTLSYRKQRQTPCSWARFAASGLLSEMRRGCGEELRPGLETWGHTTIDSVLIVPNPAS